MARVLIAAGALGAAISTFRKSHDQLMESAHLIAVSVLNYTAKSGRVDMLNDFHSGLSAPLAGAFKQYIGRIIGTDKDKHWLAFASSKFTLVIDKQAERDAFLKLVPKYLEGTPNTEFAPFTTRIQLDRSADVFGNAEFAKGLDNLIKRMQRDGSQVSKELQEVLFETQAKVENIRVKLDKQATAKAGQNAIMVKKAKPEASGAALAH